MWLTLVLWIVVIIGFIVDWRLMLKSMLIAALLYAAFLALGVLIEAQRNPAVAEDAMAWLVFLLICLVLWVLYEIFAGIITGISALPLLFGLEVMRAIKERKPWDVAVLVISISMVVGMIVYYAVIAG